MLIGEVARRSGVSARMLRHYESLGLVRPSGRTVSGYREYSGEDIQRIFHVESLRSLGLSLREIGRALDDPGFTPPALVEDLIGRTRERIAAETELLTRLCRIDATDPTGWEDVLQVVALLQALESTSAGTRQRAALSSAHDVTVPVEALVEAALGESDANVAGALRWALARTGDPGSALLAEGLGSPVAAVRERAVRALAEIPGDETTTRLRDALANHDVVVRRYAALALGTRGVADAVPTLVDMVVDGSNDTDAADALSVLAGDTGTADRIASALVDLLTHGTTGAPARGRLTQALAGIPGTRASTALAELSHDPDRAVALTAAYVLRLRGDMGGDMRTVQPASRSRAFSEGDPGSTVYRPSV
ncbi:MULTISPECIES: HEAT repeat domain-containing protein [Streptomyces]|uniref:MerR family DNA-binding transcriptional regulator n=1 Tax=Streptomyces albidocamelliae TaxID=2981135 RepID=A0ABY6EF94_9ACTN|nr:MULTISPECIES: MerR family transcriptional regulator [unclassified Streptomyces]ROP55695.1 transcriptional regulator [Streptomyces sp. PanSC9]UXY33545.1 MerR family DNA-binding transcriptional regulator [Streptomyces sp. HUAS 14-6]